ncbi:MAG: hypothetical protein EWM72_01525 [Nitrospira sp.]|nr:MAG: hypothetical protein EWM72_01525 [Nitrospira sp.]
MLINDQSATPDPQELQDEQRRMSELRGIVDWAMLRLRHDRMTRNEALRLIEGTREAVLALCPGKAEVFDLVLRPRLLRIDKERRFADWGLVDSMN